MAYKLTIRIDGIRVVETVQADDLQTALKYAHTTLVDNEEMADDEHYDLAACGIETAADLNEYWKAAGYDSVVLKPIA